MKRIDYKVYTGFVGGTHHGSFEVDDDCTEKEIESMVFDAVLEHIEWDYTIDGEPV